jgi:hypothetical protein
LRGIAPAAIGGAIFGATAELRVGEPANGDPDGATDVARVVRASVVAAARTAAGIVDAALRRRLVDATRCAVVGLRAALFANCADGVLSTFTPQSGPEFGLGHDGGLWLAFCGTFGRNRLNGRHECFSLGCDVPSDSAREPIKDFLPIMPEQVEIAFQYLHAFQDTGIVN